MKLFEESDNRKKQFLESIGLQYIGVNEKNYKDLARILEWSVV